MEDIKVLPLLSIHKTALRIRIFLFSLDPMHWLCPRDRVILYNNQICTVAILKASTSVDLANLPAAYPLPYGEYLGEVEALHLIQAHDLYNELRSLVSDIQGLEIREFPVMLLVMMVAFFTPTAAMGMPDKVAKVHDYYTHRLQVRKSEKVIDLCALVSFSESEGVHKYRFNMSSCAIY